MVLVVAGTPIVVVVDVAGDVSGSVVSGGAGSGPTPTEEAERKTSVSPSTKPMRFIVTTDLTVPCIDPNRAYRGLMFGPLNGVRTALVAAAALAALAALLLGYTAAALVLLLGVGIHGLGWLYLYSKRSSDRPE